jgi:hypothetical protein
MELVGTPLQHKDSRLEGGILAIRRSVDISDQLGKQAPVKSLRLDYAYDAEGYLLVEISSTGAPKGVLQWSHPCFRVRDIRVPYDKDEKFRKVAEQLGFKTKRLGALIRSQSEPLSELRRAA